MDPVGAMRPVGGLVTAPTRPAQVLGGPGRSRQWRIRCQDVANRERFLTLFVEHGKVVLVGPPGESAVLTPAQLGQLRAALQEAADEAER